MFIFSFGTLNLSLEIFKRENKHTILILKIIEKASLDFTFLSKIYLTFVSRNIAFNVYLD